MEESLKRQLVAALVVFLGIGSAGCPSSHGPSGSQTFVAGSGSLIHEASRIAFPARVGGFARDGTRQYAADGSDVSAAYNYVCA